MANPSQSSDPNNEEPLEELATVDAMGSPGTMEDSAAAGPRRRLSVIGIGASAGGLAALRAFFAALPSDSGLTFVVIVHLSPEHESTLAELLQGYTLMPVMQVQARIEMEPDHVYVIPPGKRLLVAAGHLELVDFEQARGPRLQIDTFFRSLAEHHGDGGAIILSGMGSDGALGIQQIKEHGGIILVQDPEEAEFDSMPKSALATGLVDVVAPAAELATQLVAAKRAGATLQMPTNPEDLSNVVQQTLTQLLAQMRMRTGHDFSGYKQATLLRRIARRMQLAQMDTLSAYLNCLRQDENEIEALYRDLLIHVTEFFRDPQAWQNLELEVVPQLFVGKDGRDSVRVWTVGCATGEEAYGIAILLLEHAATLDNPPAIQVFASDLGKVALEYAREGVYPEAISADVSEERLARFFVKDNSHYRVRPDLRQRVLFAPHNLLQDPPFSKLDLILCRNVLIYLQRPVQTRVFDSFYYALRPQGYLFLGSAETIDGITEHFDPLNKKHHIYQRSLRQAGTVILPTLFPSPRLGREGSLGEMPNAPPLPSAQGEAGQHHLLLEELGPPSLLVNDHFQVLRYSETVGRYLQHPAGSPTQDVTLLVRPELQAELRLALHRAQATGTATRTLTVLVQFNGAPHPVTILVRPSLPRGRILLLFWEDDDLTLAQPLVQASADPNSALQTELQQTQLLLQAMGAEHETALEELRAANEELQSMNEEYRSTVEELETSKEELQSMNEELQSVNQQMRGRVDEVTQTNNDMQNLFAATEIATVFLDRELCVKRYTPQAAELFNLMPADRGRPIAHLRSNLFYTTLETDARKVLSTLTPIEHEIEGEGGRWFLTSVRPYLTSENKIDGVVLTCVDITTNKIAEQALHEAKEYAESIVETIPDALLVLDTDLRVQSANQTFYSLFQVDPAATVGRLIYELGNGQWDIPELHRLLEDILPDDHIFSGYEVDHYFEQLGRRTMLLNGRRLDHVQLILLAITDITQRKEAEETLRQSETALRASEERQRLLVESVHDYALYTLDPAGVVASWNEGARRIKGYSAAEIIGQPVQRFYLPEDVAAGKPEREMQRALTTGRSEDESWRVRKDGTLFWGNEIITPLRSNDGTLLGFTKVTRDLTERRQWEERLEAQVKERTAQVRDLVTQLTMSEQEERRRISAVLHDDVQQRLYSLNIQLTLLNGLLMQDEQVEERQIVEESKQALQELINLTRNLSVDLSPPVLHNEGLAAALRWLASQMEQQQRLVVTVEAAENLPTLNEDLRVLLFRFVRELLFNIVKHAKVDKASVVLAVEDNLLAIRVSDQGQGFTIGIQHNPVSQGLLRIKQRLQLMGGHMQIDSRPHGGTHVTLYVPLYGMQRDGANNG